MQKRDLFNAVKVHKMFIATYNAISGANKIFTFLWNKNFFSLTWKVTFEFPPRANWIQMFVFEIIMGMCPEWMGWTSKREMFKKVHGKSVSIEVVYLLWKDHSKFFMQFLVLKTKCLWKKNSF